MKWVFRLNQAACISAWWCYILLRYAGIINHPQDTIIVLFLFIVMVVTVFYTFGRE